MNKSEIKNILNKENPVVFEIGCANGQDSIEFLNTFSSITLYCFEPEPKNIKIIKDTIKDTRHYFFEGVVSDIDGELEFNRSRVDDPNVLSFSGSIKKPKEHLNKWPSIKFDQTIKVPSITLDKFCCQNKIELIDFIWADVQGAEENIIKGGKNTFANKVKYFYTEYSNVEYYEGQANLEKILNLLGSHWSVVHNYGEDVLLKNNKIT